MRISLKIKLLGLLLLLSSTMLSVYAYFVLKDFRQDKLAYVFDSTLMHARGLASLIRTEVQRGLDQSQAVFAYFSIPKSSFLNQARVRLTEERNIEAVEVVQLDGHGKAHLVDTVTRNPEHFQSRLENLAPKLAALGPGQILVSINPESADGWILAAPVNARLTNGHLMTIGYFATGSFLESFRNARVLNNYVVSDDLSIMIFPTEPAYEISARALKQALTSLKDKSAGQFGAFEALRGQRDSLLVSYASVGAGGLKVISTIPFDYAIRTSQLAIKKSIFFWIFLLSISTIFGVLASSGLTNNLKRLHMAMSRFGQGDLNARFEVKGQDEVSDLGAGFNQMTSRIQDLISVTAEKVRMEGELKTAQLLQSTIFPEEKGDSGRVYLHGYYRPANECSGDWWTHTQNGDCVWLGIADATGHGAPAALVTSAARSAFSVLSRMPNLNMGDLMQGMNQAIFETAQGKMQMTATMACLNQNSGELVYSVASHEPTCWLRTKDRPLTRQNISHLKVEPGRRWGEMLQSQYPEGRLKMSSGDILFFYSDGLTELRNAKGEMLQERAVYLKLVELFNRQAAADEFVKEIDQLARDHQGDAPLEDDVTFIVVSFT